VRAHTLRHTYNVVARSEAGLDEVQRAGLLNQTDTASVRRYDHLLPDETHDARERVRAGLQRTSESKVDRPFSSDPTLFGVDPALEIRAVPRGRFFSLVRAALCPLSYPPVLEKLRGSGRPVNGGAPDVPERWPPAGRPGAAKAGGHV
jgi:hypothetical protein